MALLDFRCETGRVVTVVCCVGIQRLSYPWLDTLNAHSKQHNLLLSDDRLREILHEPYHTDRICARREDDKQTEDEPMTSRPQKSRVLKGSLFISISIEPICPRLARRQLCVCALIVMCLTVCVCVCVCHFWPAAACVFLKAFVHLICINGRVQLNNILSLRVSSRAIGLALVIVLWCYTVFSHTPITLLTHPPAWKQKV